MNRTTLAASLDWRGNKKGTWKALVKDMAPGSAVAFSEEYTATVSGRTVVVASATAPVGTVTYDSELTNYINTPPLYGAGSVSDSLEAVAGNKTVRMGVVDLGTLTWGNYNDGSHNPTTYPNGYTNCSSLLSQKKGGYYNFIIPGYITKQSFSTADKTAIGTSSNGIIYIVNSSFIGKTGAQIAEALSGVYCCYELATPIDSDETGQSLSLTTGDDTVSGADFETEYEGTNYSIPLVRNCKYLHRSPDGTESLVTGSTTNTSINVKGGESKLINLTHWFGRNKEPSIAEFYKLYPTWKTYDIPYNPGSVLNYKGTGIETRGFNAYDHSTGTAALLGGNKYQICGAFTSVSYVDVFGEPETIDLDSADCFTPVNDGVLTVTGGNGTDTLVHLVWSGYKNHGELEYVWEPFTRNVREFPISTYFSDGMNSVPAANGTDIVSDELTPGQVIQRVGVVDLGSLNYNNYNNTQNSTYPYGYVMFNFINKQGGISNLRCSLFVTTVSGDGFTMNKSITGTTGNSNCYIINSDFIGMTGEQIKAALSGVLCYYELATPIITQLDRPLNLAYPVNDFGTEHMLPQNTTTLVSTALKANVKYNTDYMRMNSQLSAFFPTVKSLVKQETDGRIMKIDSYAPNARVGAADNLIDKNAEGTPAEFTFRSSGGDVDLTDGTAIAKKIKGTTLNLNQLVHDTNQNTVSGAGQVEVEDAVAGDIASLVIEGMSLVRNQLVPPTLAETEDSVNGVVDVTDAVAGNAKGLVMTAPRSVVVNQLVPDADTWELSPAWPELIANSTVTATQHTLVVTGTNTEDLVSQFWLHIGEIPLRRRHKYIIKINSNDTGLSGYGLSLRVYTTDDIVLTDYEHASSPFAYTFSGADIDVAALRIFSSGNITFSPGWSVSISLEIIDLTQYFNGDDTMIDSIIDWEDDLASLNNLVAYDPRFASYVACNMGTVTGVTPSVQVTGKNLFDGQIFNTDTHFVLQDDGSYKINHPGQSYQAVFFTFGTRPYSGQITVSYKLKYASANTRGGFLAIRYTDGTNTTAGVLEDTEYHYISLTSNSQKTVKEVYFSYGSNVGTWLKDIQIELGSSATTYEPYHSGGTATSPVPLYGVGTATDSYDAVTGKVGHKTRSISLPSTGWTVYGWSVWKGFSCVNVLPVAETRPFYISSNSTIPSILSGSHSPNDRVHAWLGVNGTMSVFVVWDESVTPPAAWLTDGEPDVSKFMAWLASNPVNICYATGTPTEETLASSIISLQTGNNVALQTDGGRIAPFSLTYDGTEFTLSLDSTHKYAYSDNGTKSIVTNATEQAVTGGQDMLVDVTRMFSGDATAINAVTSWNDMAAVMPEYLSNVAYNEGEVVGRSGGVTTAKWNQLVTTDAQMGNIMGVSYATLSHNENTRSYILTVVQPSIGNGIHIACPLFASHKYAVLTYVTSTEAGNTIRLGHGSPTWTSATTIPISSTAENRVSGIVTCNKDMQTMYIYSGITSPGLSAGTTFTIRDLQVFDLTEIYGAGHEPATVEAFEADCAKWGKDLTQYQPYDAGTPMGGSATFNDLHGVGEVRETLDIVTGEKQVKYGSYTFTGNENWTKVTSTNHNHNVFYAGVMSDKALTFEVISDKYVNANMLWNSAAVQNNTCMGSDVVSARSVFYVIDDSITTVQEMATHMAGSTVYYPLEQPTTSTETPQPLTFAAGLNNVHEENMDIAGTPIDMEYTGTDYVIPTKSSRKYVKTIDDVTELVTGGSAVSVRGGRDNLIDLTRMFGAGLEPGTLDAFYSLFPAWRGYRLPYNKGSLLNYKGTGLKSVGFNLLDTGNRTLGTLGNTAASNTTVRGIFDETKYYVGLNSQNYYYPTQVNSYSVTGTQIAVNAKQSTYGVAFPIRVIPGMTYRFEETYIDSANRFAFYTYNGTYISGVADRYAEAPENAYWCLVIYAPITANTATTWTDPCVHLQWSGTRNGDYEPYWSYTRPVPTLTYFPSGMNGRGDVYDEMNERNYVKRLGMVDLGTLNWTHTATGPYGYWESTGIASAIKKPADHSSTVVLVSALYTNGSSNAVSTGDDMSLNMIGVRATSGNIRVNNGSATDHPAGWLVYELATPVVTTYSEAPNVTAQISDFGTEESLPANGYEPVTAPFSGVVLYASDYARTITKLRENYISKESMEALLALVGPLLNGAIGMTYNQSTGEYAFNFTANP